MEDAAAPVRLDKWLWAARFYKTRAMAAQAIDGGRVQVNGRPAKRARLVRVGDVLRLRRGSLEYRLTIRAVSERRGPAKVAAGLYEEDAAAKRLREDLVRQLRAAPTAFYEGKGRPTKKQRRDIDRFKDALALAVLLTFP